MTCVVLHYRLPIVRIHTARSTASGAAVTCHSMPILQLSSLLCAAFPTGHICPLSMSAQKPLIKPSAYPSNGRLHSAGPLSDAFCSGPQLSNAARLLAHRWVPRVSLAACLAPASPSSACDVARRLSAAMHPHVSSRASDQCVLCMAWPAHASVLWALTHMRCLKSRCIRAACV
jgi:hypothetical protein